MKYFYHYKVALHWIWTTGNEIFLPLQSCTPQGDTFIYVDIDAIDNKVNIINNPKIIRTANAPSRATRYTKAGDVLFSMVRPYLRNIAIVQENGWIASTGFYVCSPSKLLLSQYCYYLMLSDYVVDGLNQYMKGDNSPAINNSHIVSWLYPIPPLSEQKRIVAKLVELMPLVEKYRKVQNCLDELNVAINDKLKKSILQEAIQGKLLPQIVEEGASQELLEQIKQERLKQQINNQVAQIECDYDFPVNWSITRLSSICTLVDGEKKDGQQICLDAKYLRGKSAGNYLQKGRFVQRGDSIILVDGENSGEVFTVPCDGYMGSTFKQLWVSSVMHLPYVLDFILFNKELLRKSKRGAAIPHLNKEIFYSLIIGIPPYQEQVRIVNKINELYSKIKV